MTDADGTHEGLAALAVAGDGEALARLCEHLEAPVFRLCLRMLGDPRDAEDAAQDILIKVITHLGSFEGRSRLTTWVHRIAVRHVLAIKRSRAEERVIDEAAFSAMLDAGLAFGAQAAPPSPEDRALATEVRLSCTEGMLLVLNRDERLALVLVDLLGFTAAEAADIVECEHDAVRQRLSRARARLGRFLEATCGVANDAAACRCDAQIAAKQALGLTSAKQRFAPLVAGDIPTVAEPARVTTAVDELRALRLVTHTFHRGGVWNAPASLRERMVRQLPTVLG